MKASPQKFRLILESKNQTRRRKGTKKNDIDK